MHQRYKVMMLISLYPYCMQLKFLCPCIAVAESIDDSVLLRAIRVVEWMVLTRVHLKLNF